MERKTLVVSTFNYCRRPWNGICYEFSEAIRQMEGATITAPNSVGPGFLFNASLFDVIWRRKGLVNALVRDLYLSRRGSLFESAEVTEDYDLCFFVCQFLREVHNVDRVRDWRKRSRLAVAFILESWTSTFDKARSEIQILDKFDLVFVLNADAVEPLSRRTKTPVLHLPTAADCLAGRPDQSPATRPIDVLCFGRRLDAVHQRMLDLARERGWFYLFDVWGGIQAQDWAQARAANAELVRRSRYSIVWDPSVASLHAKMIGGDRALTTRYFEAAAGGAILFGSRTPSAAFDACFDWPDALVEIAPDGSDLAERLDAFENDPVRSSAVRRANVLNCLKRHDWAHRWETILDHLNLPKTPAHESRLAQLSGRAEALMAA